MRVISTVVLSSVVHTFLMVLSKRKEKKLLVALVTTSALADGSRYESQMGKSPICLSASPTACKAPSFARW